MKKLIAGLIAAFAMVAGLVTVSGGTANAATYNPGPTPPLSVPKPAGLGTSPATAPTVKAGKAKVIKIKYNAPAGTVATITVFVGAKAPSAPGTGGGKAKAIKTKVDTKAKTKKVVKPGQVAKLKLPKLKKKKGTYRVWVTITPNNGPAKVLKYYIKVK